MDQSEIVLYISLLAIAISFMTLIYTMWHNSMFARREVISQQIKIVLDLLKAVNESKMEVGFVTNLTLGSVGKRIHNLNLWEIHYHPESQFNDSYNDETVIFESGSNQIFDIEPFINNPLLPEKIHLELQKLYSRETYFKKNIEDLSIGPKCIIIKSSIFYDSFMNSLEDQKEVFNFSNAIAFKTWESLKAVSENLKKEIDNYLKKQIKKTGLQRIDY